MASLAAMGGIAGVAAQEAKGQSGLPDVPSQTVRGAQATLLAVQQRMPKTEISSIDCVQPMGLCEVRAGDNIFYVDKAAKYLFIGHVYDLNAKIDLTEARLRTVAGAGDSDGLAGGQVVRASAPRGGNAAQQAIGRIDAGDKIDPRTLPAGGGIAWGREGGTPVVILTDFRCPYCRAVAHELEQMNVKVTEYPISILGSRSVANSVFCSRDRAKAVRDAYAGIPLGEGKCDTRALDRNEEFARQHGIQETPVLIRSDGAVLKGYRAKAILEAWLAGKAVQ
ncbi:MAG: DsbC family protein [Betaproteobacteria bacterium]|nr:DsbC family protein [Betaproteobacteria bacterium]